MPRLWLPLVILAGTLSSGCSTRPEIGRNLPGNFEEGDRVFNARIAERYGPGTVETKLEADLQAQGFVVDTDKNRAEFILTEFPCRYRWFVEWKAESDVISETHASYGEAGCL